MDSTIIAGVITALIGATAGIIVKHFLDSWKEKRQGILNEAQRIAKERDEWKLKAEAYYNRKQRFKDVLWEHRRIARAHGITDDELPEVPPDDH